jgi:hypothetical protein
MNKRARQYRELAAETRAIASTIIHEDTRKGMLEAASVWDRLADIAELQAARQESHPWAEIHPHGGPEKGDGENGSPS